MRALGKARIAGGLGAVLLFVLLGAIVFAPHFDHAFQFDDSHSVVDNPSIRSFTHWRSWLMDLGAFSILPENLNYRPLLLASYAVSYRIAGLEPWGFRLLNWLIHLVAALLVYEIARRLLAVPRAWPKPLAPGRGLVPPTAEGLGLLAGLVFLLHPVESEPVHYISARSESLAAGCVLLAFAVRLAADRASAAGQHREATVLGAASAAAYVAGLFTKEIALTFPALVVWHDLVLGERQLRPIQRLRSRIGTFAVLGFVSAAYLLWRARLIPPAVVAARSGVESSTYFWTQVRAWPHYLREFVWPAGLHVDNTAFGWSTNPADPRVLGAIAAIAAVAALAWLLRRRVPLAGFGLGWFWIALLPAASWFPLAEPVNGHRAYLAGAGLALATVALLGAALGAVLASRPHLAASRTLRRAVPAGAAGCLFLLALGTWERGRVWESPATLWAEVVARSPANGRGWMNLGLAQMASGDLGTAAGSFDRAIACAPGYALAYVNRAILRRAQGDPAGARSDTERSLELAPGNVFVQYWAAKHGAETGNLAGAAAHAAAACSLSPAHVPAIVLALDIASRQGEDARVAEQVAALDALGPAADEGRAAAAVSLLTTGRPAIAHGLLAPVVARHSDWNAARFNLGYALILLGRLPEAEREFAAVLAREPANAAAEQNLRWIAAQSGASPPGSTGPGPELRGTLPAVFAVPSAPSGS